jgi:hypothetical protein
MKQFWGLWYKELRYVYKKHLWMLGIIACLSAGIILRAGMSSTTLQKSPVRIDLYQKGQYDPVETINGILVKLDLPSNVFFAASREKTSSPESLHHIEPEGWSAAWEDQEITLSVNGKIFHKKANRIDVSVGTNVVYKLDVSVDQQHVWQRNGGDVWNLSDERIVELSSHSPFGFWLMGQGLVGFLFMLTGLLWVGGGLLALYSLAHALNSERTAGTLVLYKSLPVSDWQYSAAKYSFHLSVHPLWVFTITTAVWLISVCIVVIFYSSLNLRMGTVMTLAITKNVVNAIIEGFRTGNVRTLLLPGYGAFVGLFYLIGGLFNRRAFLYALLLVIGTGIVLNILTIEGSQPLGEEMLQQILLLPWYIVYGVVILWNGVCFLTATLMYARKGM